jgi:HD-GYP domain-containing protein (c-di-GMP phosphodiesterase class II)
VSAEEVARREKAELLHRQKDPVVLAEVGWERAADTVRDALLNLARTPRAAGEQLASLSRDTAASIAEGEQVLLHLLGDKQGDGPQFHALNVMTLSMLVGKAAELTEGELADLALGALAHDAGKDKVPSHILKNANRKKHEEDFYRQHVQFGLTFAQESGVFSRRALAVIADHHEALDGSGFPSGKSQLDVGARIVGMVNRYDRLCSPEAEHAEALMPTEALAQMYRTESNRFDPRLLALMIKMLGVFPPGTLVRLSDDSIALVVAPGKDSLRPTVLVYAPQLNKDSAPTLDLSSDTPLRIKTALKPSALAPKVTHWFRPRQRLSYFYSSDALER